ncbi:PucR C-terminal helix-turn-helix domain-containing protein [Blastococcus sp. DSM 46786]|uniref:PucR family transcriptional regulator n=1 Tax=Blastococcus sp. DSM 46786 TaxID=1798227 RepID=UPI0008C5367D|nr:PucR family transcriptional regulator [Blastococcus sp. DSM 46786]SEL01139.1 PucR C-terminal helix-turn-helix domain-containing protein [Blastococcus sp. DSM 46786]
MPHAYSDDALTLARLLQEPALRRARIHAGRAGAVTRVEWVVPWSVAAGQDDPLTGVLVHAHPGELARDQVTVTRAAERLAACGAAALLVDGHQPVASDAVAACQLPLVTMADTVPFAALNRLVADLTLARETHVLRYGLTVHRALAELLYRGAELSALCSQLNRMSQRPVAVFDNQGQLAALEQGQPRTVEAADLVTAFAEQGDALGTRQAPEQLHPRTVGIRLADRELACIVTPIVLGGRHDGWILLLEESDDPHPHDLAEHRVLVEQAAPIVGTEMLRLRSVQRAKEQARGDFVHGLLHGRFATAEDISPRAAHYGFPVRSWFGVVVASGMAVPADVDSPARLQQVGMEAARLLSEQGRHTQAAMVGDVLVVVREAARRGTMGTPEAAAAAIGDYATALHQYLSRRKDQGGRPVRVTYGRPAVGALAIPDSYREARMAHGLQQRLGLPAVCGFQELRVHAVLEDVAGSRTGRSYATDLLAPLRDPSAGELEATVLAYIAAGGNVNAASRDLHIHRNTMLYKLDRASRLLGMDLRQAENQFAVWLAHTLDLLATTTAEVDRVVSPG